MMHAGKIARLAVLMVSLSGVGGAMARPVGANVWLHQFRAEADRVAMPANCASEAALWGAAFPYSDPKCLVPEVSRGDRD